MNYEIVLKSGERYEDVVELHETESEYVIRQRKKKNQIILAKESILAISHIPKKRERLVIIDE